METITIKKEDAIKAHKAASGETKKVLEMLMPDVLGNIWERINSFSDVCREAGVDETELTITDDMPARKKRGIQAERLFMLEQVFNGGVDINYADTSQYKYRVWVNIIPDATAPRGLRLSCHGCVFVIGFPSLGSRHAFVDKETAIKVFEKFPEEYINSFIY